MRIQQLEYFVAVAEELHFGRAARRLHIEQPPLSRQIRALEKDLGVLLFDRTNRRVELTEAGTLFLAEAREIIRRLRGVRETLRALGSGESGTLRVGFIDAMLGTGFVRSVGRFRERYPQVRVELEERWSSEQVDLLREGSLHVGFVNSFVTRLDGLGVRVLGREPYQVALPEAHPLARLAIVPLTALAGLPFIFYPRRFNPALYDSVMDGLARGGLVPTLGQEVRTTRTAEEFVGAGLGWCLKPSSAPQPSAEGVVYRPIDGMLVEVEIAACWNRERETPLVRNFLEYFAGKE